MGGKFTPPQINGSDLNNEEHPQLPEGNMTSQRKNPSSVFQ